jgi:hypothetical protein
MSGKKFSYLPLKLRNKPLTQNFTTPSLQQIGYLLPVRGLSQHYRVFFFLGLYSSHFVVIF